MLYLADRRTTVPKKEIGRGLLASMLRDPNVDRGDFWPMRYAYPCVLNPEEEGGFFVVFPDVPGALTCGDDRAEALEMAADALVARLASHVHNGEDLPTPSSVVDGQEVVAVPPIPAAKLALYSAMREQGLSKAALAKQVGLDEASVGQLLDPDRYSHISRVTNALRAVGRSLVVEDRVA